MNQSEIIERLKQVLSYYSLTSSTFADTIDVQRSSISHLMSGRNKPSLDFVMKVVSAYPEVDLYWLLNGEGSFPKIADESKEIKKDIEEIPNSQKSNPSLFDEITSSDEIPQKELKSEKKPTSPRFPQNEQEVDLISNTRFSATGKKIAKVILLYTDGTFDDFEK